ncbi:MAG: hypothetical protein V1895_04210, partial [Parcubacteria group bacterium]
DWGSRCTLVGTLRRLLGFKKIKKMHFPRGPHNKRKLPFQRQAVRKVATPDSVHRRADGIARHVVHLYEQLQEIRDSMEDLFDLEIAQGGLSWVEHERRMLLEQRRAGLVEELASLREQIAGNQLA